MYLGALSVGGPTMALAAWAPAGCLLSFSLLGWGLRLRCNLANAVTLTRLVLAQGALHWVCQNGASSWLSCLLLAAAASLDAADGWAARRFGGQTHGDVLDMECDQFVVLALALVVWRVGGPALVLALPGLRYGYVLLLLLFDRPTGETKPRGHNGRGRAVCAAVVTGLVVLTIPNFPGVWTQGFAWGLVGLLGWSFGSDLAYLLGRPAPGGVAS